MGGKIINVLKVSYKSPKITQKEIEITSLEQIIKKHIKLPDNVNFLDRFLILAADDKRITVSQDSATYLKVLSPTLNTLNLKHPEGCHWTLLSGIKAPAKRFSLLLISNIIWGIPLDLAMRLKQSLKTTNIDKVEEYILAQFYSMLNAEEKWLSISIYA